MTWYSQREGDAIVIREETEGDEGDYIAEIDARYLNAAEWQKAQATADRIVDAENSRQREKVRA